MEKQADNWEIVEPEGNIYMTSLEMLLLTLGCKALAFFRLHAVDICTSYYKCHDKFENY